MGYDVIVVGAGIAGLTAAAYLSKDGYKVLVCEKEKKVGGLINSFNYDGFVFDGGIRAIENSGIVMPMLRQLGLEIEFLENKISIGIGENIVKLNSRDSINDYNNLLSNTFKDNISDIEKIIDEIKKNMKHMDILYGIDNPLFLDVRKDKEYLFKTILPWMFKYIFTINKIIKLNISVDKYLQRFTNNQALIDMLIQHFFNKTPAFFALSYFGIYLDYKYPKGGTGAFIEKIEKFILDNKGEFKKETKISRVNPQIKKVIDSNNNEYSYKKLIWASDLKGLYNSIDVDSIINKSIRQKIVKKKEDILDKKGGDSILTLYITLDLDKSYFENICTEHFFYTPSSAGLSNLKSGWKNKLNKEEIINWIKGYYGLTTYEISIPVMRDISLAPKGKTGIIISTLMDYCLIKHISEMKWYEEFKKISEEFIIDILNKSIFKGIKNKVVDRFVSTPLTIENITGNTDGAITGWAFTNSNIPVEYKMTRIVKSVDTPIPDVFQVGQWTFSPSGFPVSILTGKLAADRVKKSKINKKNL